MAVENNLTTITKLAASDQSANQYRFVETDSAGRFAACNAAGEHAIGVLQDKPDAIDRAGCIAIGGQTKIVLGATVAKGAKVATDNLGRAVTAATTNRELGVCTEGGTVGLIGSIIFEVGPITP